MARIVCVHGIGQQLGSEEQLLGEWLPELAGSTGRAGAVLAAEDVRMAFYGDLFLPAGRVLGVGEPRYTADDIEEGLEQELLLAWWQAAAELEAGVLGPEARTLLRTPGALQAGLRTLSRVPFFAGVAMRAMVSDVKQVRRYLTEPGMRERVWERLDAVVDADTRVVVAHSLGSVVAYEALCRRPDWPVRALITIGSPLGIRNLIFDRLLPPPQDGTGHWPGPVAEWTNLADAGDVVALVKDLSEPFGARVRNHRVHNGPHAHDARPYLGAEVLGAAVAAGLRGTAGLG
ncbi:hypothetical protein [Kitasatospora viridis]|uniref:Uncharacterized protein n=1 Tax=Kitasatospora viridis TaxID=281105 RepID=A0A561TSA4_9ACTN|nr:hypothetical protein [Kitasatospora viridis]TWF89993.1 hypothetical protein FHX73_1337 [Kitasatospora viridis]